MGKDFGPDKSKSVDEQLGSSPSKLPPDAQSSDGQKRPESSDQPPAGDASLEITIQVNNQGHRIVPGSYECTKLKELLGIDVDHVLQYSIEGAGLITVQGDGKLEVKAGVSIMSHPGGGKAS